MKAAAIIIGDEILSGKVRDVNTPLLIERLRELGVELWRVSFIGDDLQDISREVRFCADRCGAVITSGGIGPTHDDRTIQGVAFAFGVPLVRNPVLERIIRTHWKDRLTEAALRMADGPQGSRLIPCEDGLFPMVAYRNVYMLPGIPELFVAKLDSLVAELQGERKVLHSIYLSCDESSIAAILSAVEEEHTGIKIGSYPRLDTADHRLWITVEGLEPGVVGKAIAHLLELLPPQCVVRVEPMPSPNDLFV